MSSTPGAQYSCPELYIIVNMPCFACLEAGTCEVSRVGKYCLLGQAIHLGMASDKRRNQMTFFLQQKRR